MTDESARTLGIIGCGWLGTAVARRAIASGWLVRGTTTSLEKVQSLNVVGIGAELFDFRDYDELPGALRANEVVLLNVPPARRTDTHRDEYPGWMEAAANQVEKSAQVIFISSTSVYPDVRGVVDEDDVDIDPDTSSVVLKAEAAVRRVRPDVTVLRLGGLYGYDRRPGRFLAGRNDVSGGNAPVNMVHRDDARDVVLRVIEKGLRASTLNVCADEHPTRAEIYQVWAHRGNFQPPSFTDAPRPWKIIANARVRSILDFAFRYPNPLMPAP